MEGTRGNREEIEKAKKGEGQRQKIIGIDHSAGN